jgi:cell division protein FtsB
MSTAGKVLVVLVLLVLPVWIILVSAVAQLNMEWTRELAKQAKQVETLQADVAKNEGEIAKLQDKIALEQHAAREQQSVLSGRLADVERSKAETTEIQSAVNVQVAMLQKALAKAELARQERAKEQQSETEGLAAARRSVDELKAANSELMSELTQLRDEFKSLLESNKVLVDRVLKGTTRRTGRPASLVR